jgi:hypothetical protein
MSSQMARKRTAWRLSVYRVLGPARTTASAGRGLRQVCRGIQKPLRCFVVSCFSGSKPFRRASNSPRLPNAGPEDRGQVLNPELLLRKMGAQNLT